jgi:adenylate kinase
MHNTETGRTDARRVILIGPPGAGKGTQAHLIASELAVPHISTGDLFRHHVGEGTEWGQRAKTHLDKGELVPDELTLAMVQTRLGDSDARAGFLLDGFPRTLDQARFLSVRLDQAGIAGVDAVVEMRVAEDEIIRRLSGRRVCARCGASWHVEFTPSRSAGICDHCGGSLLQREDDREASIRRRLTIYAEQTTPVIDFYHRQDLLVRIDATGPVSTVHSSLIAALTVHGKDRLG